MSTRVIKRNGEEVMFNKDKIIVAVSKANEEVPSIYKMNLPQIEDVALQVERQCEKLDRAVSVEMIQDLVEKSIMEHRAYEVAQKYVRFRFKKDLARKSNTTDDKILSLIDLKNEEVKQENSNKNPVLVSTQRDYMAGEVSKDLCERLLIPTDIWEAHKDGRIHFHDSDYFAQHMHNCCLINANDMLQNGTIISDTLIEKPHSFSTACTILTQIIAQVSSSQYGGQTVNLAHLAPFVEETRIRIKRDLIEDLKEENVELTEDQIKDIVEKRVKKDVAKGVQTIQYQVLTLMTTNGWSSGCCKIA